MKVSPRSKNPVKKGPGRSQKNATTATAFSNYLFFFGKKASCRYEPIEFLERGQHFRRSVDRASLKKMKNKAFGGGGNPKSELNENRTKTWGFHFVSIPCITLSMFY